MRYLSDEWKAAEWKAFEEEQIGDVEYPLCRNAYAGESAWFCYHYAGRITSGKESLNEHNRCEACAIAVPPYAEEPSFMQTNEE